MNRKNLSKRILAGTLVTAISFSTMLTACQTNEVSQNNVPLSSAENTETEKEQTSAANLITSAVLPKASWQAEITFPDWAGYTDNTLAMNSMYSFKGYEKQGTLYLSSSADLESFRLFINNQEIDITAITPGETFEVDIHDFTVNGTNTIQVSNIAPESASVQVNIPYPIIIDKTAENHSINPEVFDTIDQIVQANVDNGFPSAQMAVIKDGQLIYQNAWGYTNSYNPDGTPNENKQAVTNDTLYDLASNTKMYSANYALQYLVSQGLVSLDTTIAEILGENFVTNTIDITYADYENPGLETNKEWKSKLTIRDILRHQAGFPADPQYHNDLFNQSTQEPDENVENILYSGSDSSKKTRQKTLESIFKTPLMYEPGTQTIYSDVDYMLLSFIVEAITGQDFADFLKETFWQPMGLSSITYNPLDNGFSKEDCAATELNGNTRDGAISFTGVRTETIQGEVHDEKAYYAMNGVSGHAGMFATATDLAKLASVMLTGGYGETKFFSQNVMDTFTAPKNESAANWGLGWWREGSMQRAWYFGTQSSSDTIGHQGWTGTLTLIDPEENLVIVYLTNKINSPVTDIETNRNKFNGNWYTASTLGFIAQIVYQGITENNTDCSAALSALLADMTTEQFKLINTTENTTAQHPIVLSGYAMIDSLFSHAKNSGNDTDWEYAKNSLSLLDKSRDAEKISSLEKIISEAGK